MEKIVYYKSFDGIKFPNEKTCLDYEIEALKEKSVGQLIFFDYNFEVMTGEYDSDNLKEAYYIAIKNENAAKYIKYLADLNNIGYPVGTGFWMWDNALNRFRCVTDREIVKLEYKLDLIEQYR